MSGVSLRLALLVLGVLPASVLPMRALAQDKPAATTVPETEEEKKEREVRRACAVALCSTLHNRKPDTGDVSCSVRKTWRKEHITKVLAKGKLSWPWGDARCSTELKFDRATLVKAMSEKNYDAQFPEHQVSCELDREADPFAARRAGAEPGPGFADPMKYWAPFLHATSHHRERRGCTATGPPPEWPHGRVRPAGARPGAALPPWPAGGDRQR